MDKEIIEELIQYLDSKIYNELINVAWKNVPKFEGFTGAVLVNQKDIDTDKNEMKIKKYKQAKKYLEALSDFSKGE